MNPIKSFSLLFILASRFVVAQSVNSKDTIETARKLAYGKKYVDAVSLLSAYETKHPAEINSVRLHVQILYWMKEYKAVSDVCETYLKNNPKQYCLKLDYGRILFESKKYDKAKAVISDYLKTDGGNVEAKNMLGTIAYWQGQPNTAILYFEDVLHQYPTNEWALRLIKEINQSTAPYVLLNSSYTNDTQPMSFINSSVESGWYRSSLLFPKISLQQQHFNTDGETKNSLLFQAGNTFSFSKIKTDIILSAGLFKSPADNKTNAIGSIGINKKLFNSISLSVIESRTPYLNTISSLRTNVMQNTTSAFISYDKSKGWKGKAEYTFQQFNDDNNIQSAYGWILSPSVKFSKIEIAIGYAYNYSDTKDSRFIAVKTLNEITAAYSSTAQITGEYNPYFTPQNQQIHSILGNVIFSPFKSLSFSVNAKIGFYAVADNPYLFLDKNTTNELVINRDFVSEKYFPMEIKGKINYTLSKKMVLEADYVYLQTFYFNSNTINLGFKYTFINEKKG